MVSIFVENVLKMYQIIIPKLPIRNITITTQYYVDKLGFNLGADYGNYLILDKDDLEVHFFLFEKLDPFTNYGQIYIRIEEIENYYHNLLRNNVIIHPNAPLENKPWGQKEFSLLDPDHNLLTFGESI